MMTPIFFPLDMNLRISAADSSAQAGKKHHVPRRGIGVIDPGIGVEEAISASTPRPEFLPLFRPIPEDQLHLTRVFAELCG